METSSSPDTTTADVARIASDVTSTAASGVIAVMSDNAQLVSLSTKVTDDPSAVLDVNLSIEVTSECADGGTDVLNRASWRLRSTSPVAGKPQVTHESIDVSNSVDHGSRIRVNNRSFTLPSVNPSTTHSEAIGSALSADSQAYQITIQPDRADSERIAITGSRLTDAR